MTEPDPTDPPPSPRPLDYRAAKDDKRIHPALLILAFMGGMFSALILALIVGGVLAGSLSGSGSGFPLVATGLVCLAAGAYCGIHALGLLRRREGTAFALGLLCGMCLSCMAEGLCFTGIGLSISR